MKSKDYDGMIDLAFTHKKGRDFAKRTFRKGNSWSVSYTHLTLPTERIV